MCQVIDVFHHGCKHTEHYQLANRWSRCYRGFSREFGSCKGNSNTIVGSKPLYTPWMCKSCFEVRCKALSDAHDLLILEIYRQAAKEGFSEPAIFRAVNRQLAERNKDFSIFEQANIDRAEEMEQLYGETQNDEDEGADRADSEGEDDNGYESEDQGRMSRFAANDHSQELEDNFLDPNDNSQIFDNLSRDLDNHYGRTLSGGRAILDSPTLQEELDEDMEEGEIREYNLEGLCSDCRSFFQNLQASQIREEDLEHLCGACQDFLLTEWFENRIGNGMTQCLCPDCQQEFIERLDHELSIILPSPIDDTEMEAALEDY